MEDRQIRLDLHRAGFEDPDALRWRDVGVMGLLGGADYGRITRLVPAETTIVKALFARLIAGIRETPLLEIEQFLDSRVVESKWMPRLTCSFWTALGLVNRVFCPKPACWT